MLHKYTDGPWIENFYVSIVRLRSSGLSEERYLPMKHVTSLEQYERSALCLGIWMARGWLGWRRGRKRRTERQPMISSFNKYFQLGFGKYAEA